MLDPKETVDPRLDWSSAIMSMVNAKVSAGVPTVLSPVQSAFHWQLPSVLGPVHLLAKSKPAMVQSKLAPPEFCSVGSQHP